MRSLFHTAIVIAAAAGLSSCITRRTVSEGGQTVSQSYVIKRPIKDAIENSR